MTTEFNTGLNQQFEVNPVINPIPPIQENVVEVEPIVEINDIIEEKEIIPTPTVKIRKTFKP